MSYYNNSKKHFINMYTEYLAYELYLDQKYHGKENNSIEVVWNGLFDCWVLNEQEKGNLYKNAIEIANKKYGIVPHKISKKY